MKQIKSIRNVVVTRAAARLALAVPVILAIAACSPTYT